jgi:hypothetical protein
MLKVSHILAVKIVIVAHVEHEALVDQVVHIFRRNNGQVADEGFLDHVLVDFKTGKEEFFFLVEAAFVVHFVVELVLEDGGGDAGGFDDEAVGPVCFEDGLLEGFDLAELVEVGVLVLPGEELRDVEGDAFGFEFVFGVDVEL